MQNRTLIKIMIYFSAQEEELAVVGGAWERDKVKLKIRKHYCIFFKPVADINNTARKGKCRKDLIQTDQTVEEQHLRTKKETHSADPTLP